MKAVTLAGRVVEGVRMVDDVYAPGEKVAVRVNLAEHPAELLRARGLIDEPLYVAASKFRAAYEAAGIGGVRAIDPTREAVDGGGACSVEIDAQAYDRLNFYARRLGPICYPLIAAVMGQGRSVSEVARAWHGAVGSIRNAQGAVMSRIIEGLEALACAEGVSGPAAAASRVARDLDVLLPGTESKLVKRGAMMA